MKTDRSKMTVRVVALESDDAADARVGGTPAERLSLVSDLSERMWSLTGLPVPEYSRGTIPLKLTTLSEQ